MRILQINKFYFINGGTSRYFFEVSRLFKEYNHKIGYFSMHDAKNYKTFWSKYFVSNISYETVSITDAIGKFVRMIYSIKARSKISKLLGDFKPDIAHIHSIYHHISPSIILELKKRNIPIVQTIHDYHLISPCRGLFHDGKICEISKPDKYYKTLLHRCIRRSLFASAAEVIEKYTHSFLGWERNYVDYFIVPSHFMEKKLIEYGIDSSKIIHLPHFVDYTEYETSKTLGDYILYFGRLSPEKGLTYLIQAMKLLPKVKSIIVGRGPQEDELRILNEELGNKNVEFVGFNEGKELKRLIANSRFTVLPSVWYDVAPISILESFACGRPMLASDIGGIPETVKDGYTGFLFEPGNVEDYAEKINRLWNNPALCIKLGKNAREFVEKNFGPEEHYKKLMKIYNRAIKLHKRN